MSRALYRGRWESPRTAKQYLAEGVAAIANIYFTHEDKQLVRRLGMGLRI